MHGQCRRAASGRRQLLGVVFAFVAQADELEHFLHASFTSCLVHLGNFQRVLHISSRSTRLEQVELLENHADITAQFTQLRLGHSDDVGAVEQQRTARGGVKAIDEADKSGLAGARVTDDADYLTGFYGESDIIKRGGFSRFIVAKDFGYAAELNASAWVLGCCAEYSSGVGVDAVCDTTVSSIRTKVGGQKLEDK